MEFLHGTLLNWLHSQDDSEDGWYGAGPERIVARRLFRLVPCDLNAVPHVGRNMPLAWRVPCQMRSENSPCNLDQGST